MTDLPTLRDLHARVCAASGTEPAISDSELDEMLDDELEDQGDWPGGICGRWDNGRLTNSCSLAGTEDCDFECPYRNSLYRKEEPGNGT